MDNAIIGHTCRGSLYGCLRRWHGGGGSRMTEMRELRRGVGLSQQACAALLDVPVETFRTWDSGRRTVPPAALQRARAIVGEHERRTELLSLDQLAEELHVHIRTLQAAARTGRLEVRFSVRSVYGRPVRLATRGAGEKFVHTHYRRFAGQVACQAPLPPVPSDYDEQLKHLRSKMRWSQEALAKQIGAAGKAVVYQ